jgi:hypothetical protein
LFAYAICLPDGWSGPVPEARIRPDLATHEPNGLSTIPSAVSDDGRTIAGQSDDPTGTIQAVVWRCR